MKAFLLLATITFLSASAHSKEKVIHSCFNEMGLYSSVVRDLGETVQVTVQYIGKDDRVFHEGGITNRDLEKGSYVRKKQAVLNKLPSTFNIDFAKKDCELKKHGITCVGGKLVENPVNAKSVYYSITTIHTTLLDLEQTIVEKKQVVSFIVDNHVHSYTASYYPEYSDKCSAD